MKTRSDFVGNSSSCSFIIHLQTDEDMKAFKKLMPTIFKYVKTISMFDDRDCCETWLGNLTEDEETWYRDVYMYIDVGKDHDMQTIRKYNELKCEVLRCGYKFKVLSDPEAHYTFGEDE